MKRAIAFVSLVIFTGIGLRADFLSAYRKGLIKLVPDATFGTKTPWDIHFNFVVDKSVTFLPDGGFFKTSFKDGKVYHFTASGDKVSEFGRVGQGPGDLNRPVSVDILDNKFLVVNDMGNSRICVFDMDGKFINQIRPEYSISSLVGLDSKSTFFNKLYRVLMRDIVTGDEKEIASFKDGKPESSIYIGNPLFDGAVYVARVGNDKFLVAYSKGRDIDLYSSAGEKLSSFRIDIPQEKITFDQLEFIMKPDPKDKVQMDGYQKVIVANKDKISLPEFHQYYLGLTVDPEEHVILFLNNLPRLSRDIAFQAYSLDGKLLAKVNVDQGDFKVLSLESLVFQGKYLYAAIEKKDAEGSQSVARVKIAD